MIETLLGGLLGGAFRLAPEILKWLDRKGERGHELAMQDKALDFEKLRGAQRMAEIGASADAAWNTGAIEALREAVAAQGQQSGVRWADALSIERATGDYLLVHGAVLCCQIGSLRSCRDRRGRVGSGHPARVDGGGPGAVGRGTELLVPRAGV